MLGLKCYPDSGWGKAEMWRGGRGLRGPHTRKLDTLQNTAVISYMDLDQVASHRYCSSHDFFIRELLYL